MNPQMRRILVGLTCLSAVLAPMQKCQADDVIIENSRYKIVWNENSETLAITENSLDDCRIATLSLAHAAESIKTGADVSPHFGQGTTLTISHTDGAATVIGLYEQLPLIAVRRSVANRSDTLRAIEVLPVLSATLDFGKPVEQLVARGTAGLTKVETGFGSYVFGAVADPESGAGVVFGWATSNRGQGIVFPGQKDGQGHAEHTRRLWRPAFAARGGRARRIAADRHQP